MVALEAKAHFRVTKIIHFRRKKKQQKNNLLFVCQHKCRHDNKGYVGLNLSHCFCFSRLLDQLVQVDSSLCDIKCSDYSFEYCGGKDTVSLYRRDSSHFANMLGLSVGQCMYIDALGSAFRVSDPRTFSCLTVPPQTSVTYRICTRKAGNCTSNEERLEQYCLAAQTSETWIEANDACRAKGRNILFEDEPAVLNKQRSAIIKSFENRTLIWLGRLRTILPTFETDMLRDENACLSVKRLAYTFYIETDSCSARKTSLCKPFKTAENTTNITNIPRDKYNIIMNLMKNQQGLSIRAIPR